MISTNVDSLVTGKSNSRKVWTTETGALTKGTALCYVSGAIGAIGADPAVALTSDDPRRGAVVAKPSTSNNQAFAGILLDSYPANALGQEVTITVPDDGVNVQVYVDGDVTEGMDTYLWPVMGGTTAGQYSATDQGVMGRGVVRARGSRTGAGLVQCEFVACAAPDSGGVQVITPGASGGAQTVTKGGATYFLAATMSAAATFTLADGTFDGQRKRIQCEAMTTSGFTITVTKGAHHYQGTWASSSIQLTSVTIAASVARCISFVWIGGRWVADQISGVGAGTNTATTTATTTVLAIT